MMETRIEKVTPGCRIVRNHIPYVIAEIHSASNYPNADGSDCWYIECRTLDGQIRYWQQDQDGGHLLPPVPRIAEKLARINPEWHLRLRIIAESGLFIEAKSKITDEWMNARQILGCTLNEARGGTWL